MQKAMALTLFTLLILLPALSFAGDSGYDRRYRYGRHYRPESRPRKVTVYKYRNNGAAIAAGVLGGILTGVVLDRLLMPSPTVPEQPQSTPYHAPSPGYPGQGDPYYEGYQQGYQQGVENGRAERFDRGQRQGYDQGFGDAASGRIWSSSQMQ
jgi:hypothetical protein